MSKRLEGKTAIVTGGGRGIGRAISVKLASEGANVVICDIVINEAAEETIKLIEEQGVKAAAYQANVTVPEDCENLFKQAVEEFGAVDILVNNAGVTRDNLLMRMKEEEFDLVIATNLKGTYNMMKAAARPMMKARYGRIVNISSVVGIYGNAGQVNYSASKAGVIGMTKSIAKELGSRGITCNAVAPGYIETDMTKVLPDEVKEAMVKNIALGRPGQPEDVAKVVAFLASDEAEYVTGQVIECAGGMSC
ncbi:MAG: 3-oxoacyl-[acyl-carrier-protein] reductase [Eubacterium sp.]|nr:3-oxoacyl-[acyl-carrier-protein] reductase [Eubacterium sp.]